MLLKSRNRFPDLHVRALAGLHPIEQDSWRWTMKRFSLEVVLPSDREVREFALRFVIPRIAHSAAPVVKISCFVLGQNAGTITCDSPCALEFRGGFPINTLEHPVLTLHFEVESSFQHESDERELGIIIPLLDASHAATERLPFRIS